MSKIEIHHPFGLLFEEKAPEPQNFILPTYDEETDLSFIDGADGHKIAYVEYHSTIGTDTVTRLEGESTDKDETDNCFVSARTTGTDTETFVQKESADKDEDTDLLALPSVPVMLGTDTFTKIEKEMSDKD